MLRCSECKKAIIEETKYQEWLKLFYFINFLLNEEYINVATHDAMIDSLMAMKEWALDS